MLPRNRQIELENPIIEIFMILSEQGHLVTRSTINLLLFDDVSGDTMDPIIGWLHGL